jgi:hypothetical protein
MQITLTSYAWYHQHVAIGSANRRPKVSRQHVLGIDRLAIKTEPLRVFFLESSTVY